MVSKLRLTLAILLSGFVIEGAIEAYAYFNHSYQLPYASFIFILGPFVTLAGLFVLWIGRFEWDELLSRRFRHAHRSFFLNVLALALAAAPVIWYGFESSEPIVWWARWEFGAAIVASLLLTFATYVLIAFELTAVGGRALLFVAFGWASVVSFWIGQALANQFGAIVLIVQSRQLDFRSISASAATFESYLAVTYVLLTVAYLDAYHRVRSRPSKSS
jgi:hypothetical protein